MSSGLFCPHTQERLCEKGGFVFSWFATESTFALCSRNCQALRAITCSPRGDNSLHFRPLPSAVSKHPWVWLLGPVLFLFRADRHEEAPKVVCLGCQILAPGSFLPIIPQSQPSLLL